MQPKTATPKSLFRRAALFLLLALLVAELALLAGLRRGSIDLSALPAYILEVSTGSMAPAIRVGDCVLVEKTPYQEVQPGDIVTYERLGTLVTHRVVEVTEEGLVTQGDANPVADPLVDPEHYRGRVKRVLPGLGRFFSLQRTPAGWVALAGLLALLVFGTDFFCFLLSLPEKRAQKDKTPPSEG